MNNFIRNSQQKSLCILLFLCLLLCTSLSVYATDSILKRVTIYPENPRVNSKITIQFDAKDGDFEFSDEVTAVLYLLQDGQWNIEQVNMVKKENKWETPFTLPAQCSFLALKFIQGNIDNPDIVDNNGDKGYYVPVLNSAGKVQQGNFIGLAMLEAPATSGGLLNTYYTTAPVAQPKAIQELLVKENKIANLSKTNYMSSYLRLQKIALGDNFSKFAKDFLNKDLSEKTLSENYLADLYSIYNFALRDSILGPQIGDRILKDYPKSNTARFVSFGRVRVMNPNVYDNIASLENFFKEYPISEWRKHPDANGYMYYTLYRVLGTDYFETKQFDKFIDLYKTDLDFKTGNELARWNIFRAYTFKSVGQDTLYQVNSQIMPYLLANKNDNSYLEDFAGSKEAAQDNAIKQLDDRLFTHISLLNDLGKYEEARKFFFNLSPEGRYATAELNEINLHVIEKLNLQNEILSHLELCVKYNAVTPNMLEKLKDIYMRKHGNSDKGFDEYLTSLKSDEEKQAMKEYVESHIISHPMPDFELENADGTTVSLSQLKDKIVVMDFWATWCRPCIMAFPGMQLVTDKYADDPQVRIYIVGTMQNGDYKNKSVNYVKESGYRFHMLHDAINPKTGEQDLLFRKLAPYFNSSGIPRKIIIKDGLIRYSSEGYSGSPSKLLDEISLAIETLKKEK